MQKNKPKVDSINAPKKTQAIINHNTVSAPLENAQILDEGDKIQLPKKESIWKRDLFSKKTKETDVVEVKEEEPNVNEESVWTKDIFASFKAKMNKKVEQKPAKEEKAEKEKKHWKLFGKKEQNEKKVEEQQKTSKIRKFWPWLIGVISLLVVALSIAGAAYAHSVIYKDKVFPGVKVWGMDVGGKSLVQVQQLVIKKVKGYQVKLIGPDQNYTASAEELGIMLDPVDVASTAYLRGRDGSFLENYLTRARLFLAQINWSPVQNILRANALEVAPDYKIDSTKLDGYVNKIANNIKIVPQDSQISVEGGNLNLVPAVFGREVLKDQLKTSLATELKGFKTSDIEIETQEVKPNIIDQAAQDVKVQTENVISRPIILTYQGTEYRPDKATVASWISYTKPEGATSYTMVVDTSKMTNYFNFLGTKINIPSVTKIVRVENGVNATTTQEGKNGLKVDIGLLGKEIASQLPVQPQVKLEIPTYVDQFKTQYDQVIVANWDKYIEVNISTQTMTAYLKGGTVVGSWAITTGRSGWDTPIGTFLIQKKVYVTDMPNPPSPYPLKNIHYVSYFTPQGHAIHEAWWRTSFGGQDYVWNGSHGCVNAPIDVAHFIYDWAPLGTPIIIHK